MEHMGIRLRKLEMKDAEYMLEWMLDPDVYNKMQYNPQEQTLETCKTFITESWEDEGNKHFAIVDSNDEYLGTVSLKNIDMKNKNAEFAIATRNIARGKGVAQAAMQQILEFAFEKLNLHKVYLYVRADNERAIRFYQKSKFQYEGTFREHIYTRGRYKDVEWYSIVRWQYTEK